MHRFHLLVYLLALAPIAAVSMQLSAWARFDPNANASRNEVDSCIEAHDVEAATASQPRSSHDWEVLARACQNTAARWMDRLGPDFKLLVRPPFVIAGNLSEPQLAGVYRQTIDPATTALARDYFRMVPDEPVVILLFSDEETYRAYALRLFGANQVSIYGFYKPAYRAVVANLGGGGGTVVHELTHALVDFDFPRMPIWLNEGLASLNEECDILVTEIGPVVEPRLNWRLRLLQRAIPEGRLRSIEDLMGSNSFRGSDEAIKYAHARYFCMYLHRLGVLDDFYRAVRDQADLLEASPTQAIGGDAEENPSRRALRRLFPDTTQGGLDREFQAWVMDLKT